MVDLYQKAADNFLELSSYQRLQILFGLLEKNSTIIEIAKKIGATKQEVHRNFVRLEKVKLIEKDVDGTYGLTTFGNSMCTQIPSLVFLSQNMEYFQDHIFSEIPTKFVMRSGQLVSGTHIKGFAKIMEIWKSMYQNANDYIYQVLSEALLDRTESIVQRVKDGVNYNYVLSETAVIPKGRKELLEKIGFFKLVKDGKIERKMIKNIQTCVIVTEKEACILFAKANGEHDLSEMFYGTDPMFHEWCLDYFRYCWYNSDTFHENRLKE